MAAELRSTIGWTQNQDALRERDGLRDQWQVVGYRATEVEQLRVQSTWLLGQTSRRNALLLDFAAGNQPLTASLVTGQVLDATVVWFDGEPPLRAILRERHGPGNSSLDLSHFAAAPDGVQAAYAAQLARCPWLEQWPMVLGPVHAVMRDGQCRLIDDTGCSLRLPSSLRHGWALRALSTRAPLHLFGEWDGQVFDPLTVSCAGEWFSLTMLGELAVLAKVA